MPEFVIRKESWLVELKFQDLQLLRKITKKVHMRHYPADLITDREADRMIEAFGPACAEEMLRKAVDAGLR